MTYPLTSEPDCGHNGPVPGPQARSNAAGAAMDTSKRFRHHRAKLDEADRLARADGTTLSALLREWVDIYVESGHGPPKIVTQTQVDTLVDSAHKILNTVKAIS